jgi:hypothetical protein
MQHRYRSTGHLFVGANQLAGLQHLHKIEQRLKVFSISRFLYSLKDQWFGGWMDIATVQLPAETNHHHRHRKNCVIISIHIGRGTGRLLLPLLSVHILRRAGASSPALVEGGAGLDGLGLVVVLHLDVLGVYAS